MGRKLALCAVVLFGAAWLLSPTPSIPRPGEARARLQRVADAVMFQQAPIANRLVGKSRHLGGHVAVVFMAVVALVSAGALSQGQYVDRHEWWRFVRSRRGPPCWAALSR